MICALMDTHTHTHSHRFEFTVRLVWPKRVKMKNWNRACSKPHVSKFQCLHPENEYVCILHEVNERLHLSENGKWELALCGESETEVILRVNIELWRMVNRRIETANIVYYCILYTLTMCVYIVRITYIIWLFLTVLDYFGLYLTLDPLFTIEVPLSYLLACCYKSRIRYSSQSLANSISTCFFGLLFVAIFPSILLCCLNKKQMSFFMREMWQNMTVLWENEKGKHV